MKILITGGAGFIGSHVAEKYLQLGHNVVILDNLSSGLEKNLPKGSKFYRADIAADDLEPIFRNEQFDVVNHLAAQISVRHSVDNPINDAKNNIFGGLKLLDLTHRYKIKKFIFSSTGGAIYGNQNFYPADESHPTNPRSPYGIAKLAVEKYLQFYHWTHKLPFTALRYANVYGSRQNAHGEAGVIAIFTKKLLKGEAPVINGDGRQTRDYVYIDDVVACNVKALKQEVQGIFNVGTGVETNVSQVAKELIKLTGNHLVPQYAPEKLGEQRRSCLRPGSLQEVPPTPLTLGLKKTVEWFKSK